MIKQTNSGIMSGITCLPKNRDCSTSKKKNSRNLQDTDDESDRHC